MSINSTKYWPEIRDAIFAFYLCDRYKKSQSVSFDISKKEYEDFWSYNSYPGFNWPMDLKRLCFLSELV